MSQSKTSQVIIDLDEGVFLTLRFAYPSFDAKISRTSQKYNHTITKEQARYIIKRLHEVLGDE